jgi:hypothetical protein
MDIYSKLKKTKIKLKKEGRKTLACHVTSVSVNVNVSVNVMVFNATFNNISVISWRSVLLMEETKDNHRTTASH